MNRYEPSTPRTAFGMIACALTIVTFSLFVAGPASLAARDEGSVVMAAQQVSAPGAIRTLPPVYVVAKREGNAESARVRVVQFLRRLYS
jgi:hypothetical protein